MADIPDHLHAALTDRYALEREVGSGGMATVYLAEDVKHRRQVAIKTLKPEVAAVLGAERFLREIEIAARLSHPNILPLYDSGETDGVLYYVMPFVAGETLAQRIRRERQLPLDDALEITREVADALAFAHAHGVIHRDIKPENVLFQAGHAVIADFGIARAITAAGAEELTKTGLAVGTPAYMSPEQASGEVTVDARADIYALGCVLYEMLAGNPPFTASTLQGVLARHAVDPVPSLKTVRMVPEPIEAAILRALAKAPADRFATATDFAEALAASGVVTHDSTEVPTQAAPVTKPCPNCGFHNPADTKFCGQCGQVLVFRCSQCGADSPAAFKFCGECGAQLSGEVERRRTPLPSREDRDTGGERRQVTVMFCGFTDTAALSEDVDPEELGDVILRYQEACAAVVERYDGHVADYLGNGLLVYFGYPRAHEDAARRAAGAALAILDGLEGMGGNHGELRLDVRIGVHTGVVVAGEGSGGAARTSLAVGKAPSVAARLHEAATPNSVVVSPATYRLIRGFFVCETVGAQRLAGLGKPMEVYRLVGETGVQSRLEATEATTGLAPLAGREQESALLRDRWEQATGGAGQVVLLSGDAGIGKSRLVKALDEALADEPHTRQECRCSPYHQNSALYPVIELLERWLQLGRIHTPAEKLTKIEAALGEYEEAYPGVVRLITDLLSVRRDGEQPSLELGPKQQREKTLEAIVTLLLETAARQPVLLVVEDLQWADPSTLELLDLIIDQIPTTRALVLLTFRPTFTPPWSGHSYLTQLTLGSLGQDTSESIITSLAGGKPLPPEVTEHIVTHTDGVPLFVEELTKMVLESDLLREADDRYELTGPLPQLAIPSTLRDSLAARLDRLGRGREVAQLGAAIGRQFSYGLLRAVSPLSEDVLDQGLRELVDAELVYRRGLSVRATYIFKHALIQDAAYDSLLKSTRREYHGRIAEALVEEFPEIAEPQPELVAQHFTAARRVEEAIGWWLQAGQRAAQRSAHVEAINHLKAGLDLIDAVQDAEARAGQELRLLLNLGGSLTATKGYAAQEVEQTFTRARELARELDDVGALCQAVSGIYRCHVVRADLHQARALGEELLDVAQRADQEDLVLEAERALGSPLFFLGRLRESREHLERGLALYDPAKHHSHKHRFATDPGLACAASLLLPLWLLGYPDQAVSKARETLILAQQLGHPFSLGHTQAYTAWLYLYRREWDRARAITEEVLQLARDHGFAIWLGVGTIFHGAALAELGALDEGIAELRRGNDAIRQTGAALNQPHFLALLAQALVRAGERDEAMTLIDEAVALADEKGDCCWLAELHRLRGAFTVASNGDSEAAERCFEQALEVARAQEAKSLELRAVMSLGRMRAERGESAEARRCLAEVYDWFDEGFDSPDLKDARALLDEWS